MAVEKRGMEAPTVPEMQRATRATEAFLAALQHLQACWTYNGPARCTHVHAVRQAAIALLPLVQQLAEIRTTSDGKE